MDYQEEPFDSFIMDALPLMVQNNDEINVHNKPLDIFFEYYVALANMDKLKCYTVRENGNMIGYIAFFINNHMHHKTFLVASQDCFYVTPRARTAGIRLLMFAEKELKKLGVETISQGAPVITRLAKVLERMGYSEIETIYIKNL